VTAGFDRSAFLGKFKEETEEHLQKLNRGLLDLEANPRDQELMNEITREAHTLKGSAKMMGFNQIAQIAHKIEDLLGQVKEGRFKLNERMCDLLFAGFDSVKSLVEEAIGGRKVEIDVGSLCEQLEKAALTGEPPSAPPQRGGRAKEEEEVEKLEEKPREEREDYAKEKKDRPEEEGSVVIEETIRVGTVKLDRLMNLVGEMVIGQLRAKQGVVDLKELMDLLKRQTSYLSQLMGKVPLESFNEIMDNHLKMKREISHFFKKYSEDTAHNDLVINDLQEGVMETRTLPIFTIFSAFPRAVRDMAKEYGKKIDLKIEGVETRLDKRMLEGLNDPLIHLIRNAVDHGIEGEEERETVGKPPNGEIILSARQEGEHVIIEVEDNGRGIDPKRLKELALKRGVISEKEAKSMSDREAIYLVFNPGLSTSKIITDTSGRGVGMDVVKKNVEEMKGKVELQSELGQLTKVKLTLPLTLAVIGALVVEARGQMFAIPTLSIESVTSLSGADIHSVAGREAIKSGGRTVPLVRLGQVLELPGEEKEEGGVGVVIGYAHQRICFLVDGLIGEQEIAIKGMGGLIKRVKNIAGATILGTGRVVPILHIPDLMASAMAISGVRVPYQMREEKEEKEPPSILVVEDSLITRELEKSILEASGYSADIAIDGLEALEKLGQKKFDLVVADIQMPRMDGFQLAEKIRKSKKYKEIPIVIVTSLEREEDKRRGIEVGADAYIVKSRFDQSNLLDTIERLI